MLKGVRIFFVDLAWNDPYKNVPRLRIVAAADMKLSDKNHFKALSSVCQS